MLPFIAMWMMVKEGGWGAFLALGLGSLGIVLGIVSLALLPIARKVGHAMGIVTLVFAFLAPTVGLLGMASGRRMTESAISGNSVGPGMKVRIRHVGYLESQQSAKVGFFMGFIPLLLGATAAFVGARKKPEDPPSSARWIVAGAGSALAFLTCGGALAATFGPVPPDMSYEESRLVDARAEIDDGNLGNTCQRLQDVMNEEYWHPTDKREWPRHFNPDPHKAVPDYDAVAKKCIENWTSAGVSNLLDSPLLVDEDQKKKIEDDAHRSSWLNGDIGDSFGVGGLGDAGVGVGGGRGEGIGLGNIGAIGGGGPHPTITSTSTSTVKSPKLHQDATTVNGRLPPEVIQRIVRQNFGRFRLCYEQGLAKDPTLAGQVKVKFVVGRDGSVSSVSDAGSTLPDSTVVACVVRGFGNLSFPQPEGGIVVVTYPITFTPGD